MPRPKLEDLECPEDIYEQMRACWDKTTDKRPSFHELRHFLENYEAPSYEIQEFEGNHCEEQEDKGNEYDR